MINKQTRILTLTLIFISLLFFLSFLPEIYEAASVNKLPADRVMIWGEHNYPYDYNVYLSKIRQGQEGRWTVVDKYDNRPDDRGVALQMLYFLSGKIGDFFGLTPAIIYHTLRIVFGLVWILVIIKICRHFLKNAPDAALATILAIFASSFPTINNFAGKLQLSTYMYWWQELDVARRLSYVPHYTLNYILLAVMIMLMSRFTNTKNKKYFMSIATILFLSFFIHPAGGLVFLGAWIVYQVFLVIFYINAGDATGGGPNKRAEQRAFVGTRERQAPHIFMLTLILISISLLPLLYFRHITATYPWKALVEFDSIHPLPFKLYEYILALGPIFWTGICGLVLVIKQKRTDLLPLASWILAAFAGILVFSIFPIQSPVRFVQTANHVPLAILTVYFFATIKTYSPENIIKRNRWRDRRGSQQTRSDNEHLLGRGSGRIWSNKFIKWSFVAITILIGLLNSYQSLKGQLLFIHDRAQAVSPAVPNEPQIMYPLKDFYYALEWLKTYTRHDQIILSKATAGNYIPAYSGNFVYLGHSVETPNFDQRRVEVDQFYMFTMNEAQTREFLAKNNIAYVFYGPQEKEVSIDQKPPYSFLKPAYQSYFVTIYKVL